MTTSTTDPRPADARPADGPPADSRPGPAEQLAELLETLPRDARREITAWLLSDRRPSAVPSLSVAWPASSDVRKRLTGGLPPGEDSQLITIRLPADRHNHLRTWCAEHGFTMAAVVRGLVERFLEDQEKAATSH
jgi:hypothetical protein